MHFRRLACLLLGAWLGCGAFMAVVAVQNFRTVDRLLITPSSGAAPGLKALGYQYSRQLLRWEASEQNRRYFETWEIAQVAIAAALFFLLLFGSTETKFSLSLSLLMLVIVLLQRILLTPMLTSLGRLIDFIPQAVRSTDRIRFGVLHSAYLFLDGAKAVLGIVLAAKLLTRSRRRQPVGNVNVIDKSDHRHVNR